VRQVPSGHDASTEAVVRSGGSGRATSASELPLQAHHRHDREVGERLGAPGIAGVVVEDGIAPVERVDHPYIRYQLEVEAAEAAAERAGDLRIDTDVRRAGLRRQGGTVVGA